jgi:hypothetical protein
MHSYPRASCSGVWISSRAHGSSQKMGLARSAARTCQEHDRAAIAKKHGPNNKCQLCARDLLKHHGLAYGTASEFPIPRRHAVTTIVFSLSRLTQLHLRSAICRQIQATSSCAMHALGALCHKVPELPRTAWLRTGSSLTLPLQRAMTRKAGDTIKSFGAYDRGYATRTLAPQRFNQSCPKVPE